MVGLLGISECPWSHPWSYPWSYWSTKIYQLHSAALSCTQLPAFCNNGARFAAYTICEYFFVAFFLHGTPGPRWSEMIWNDLKWSEMIWNDLKWSEMIWGISTTKPCLPDVFWWFLKTMESLRDITTWYYNDWTTGNMNSVSFTKTLENFDMESQKLGFRAVPTGNGNFWGTGVRCTGFHNRSLFSATNM